MTSLSNDDVHRLSDLAWSVRKRARILGPTAVGCAALSASGAVYGGCNIEHRFRSHDIHAEVNTIGTMVSAGDERLAAVLIAAERERFTPCGACLDWIFELGGGDCIVAVQTRHGGQIESLLARELMPHYPR
jgi:cytidine deaminase